MRGYAERVKAEIASSVTEIKNTLAEMKVVAAQVKQVADRAAALENEQKIREEGMKALWNRMVTVSKKKNEGGTVE
jgi:chorismate mutase